MAYADSMVRGGANRVDLFTITTNAAVVEATGDYVPAKHSFMMTISTGLTLNDDGTWTIALDNVYDNEDLQTLLDSYGPEPGAAEDEQYTFEDGNKTSGSNDTTKYLVAVVYGAKNTANTKRKTWQGIVVFSSGVGSYSQESGKATKPKIELVSVKAPAATTIPVGCFNGDLVTAAEKTIAVDSYGTVVWMTKGTV